MCYYKYVRGMPENFKAVAIFIFEALFVINKTLTEKKPFALNRKKSFKVPF